MVVKTRENWWKTRKLIVVFWSSIITGDAEFLFSTGPFSGLSGGIKPRAGGKLDKL